MRPQYETAEDRIRERAALDEYLRLMKIEGSFLQTRQNEFFDAILLDAEGDQVSLWEVKHRNDPFEKLMGYGGVFFEVQKFMKIRTLATVMNMPAFFLLKTPDGLWVRNLKEEVEALSYGGRSDRGDPADIQLCVLLKDFREIGESK